ncbi:DEAD/DEAH box helicase [Brevibacillus borstelensis]|uniref:DEAD/DEAH box helicase n=1 Tax=Brevibacillus borstelensis TaxID=45462 RepID=UPI003CE4B426
MGFKSKYRGGSNIESPEALFYDLRNRSVEGLLSHQADVLREYKKDLVDYPEVAMELPTGSGKTLIGLLVGEWRRRQLKERVVYLCPTKQLVHQVVDEARTKFGINTLAFTGSQRDYHPKAKAEYNQGEAIAVTTYSSLFNTNPFFYNPNFIVLDDAHASENYIVKHWSLNISRYDFPVIYAQLLEILKDGLPPEQYQRMLSDNASPNDKAWVEKIPTPKFVSQLRQVIPYLDEAVQGQETLKYNWSVLREHLRACHVYVNYGSILIRPIIPPTLTHPPFSHANQRLYMSATLGLGGELERITGRDKIKRIKAPEGWEKHGVGRRLFFFPGVALNDVESNKLVHSLIKESSRSLILVPDQQSADDLIAEISQIGSKDIYQASDIEHSKHEFTKNTNAVAVLANRYDGINLIGDECRLEIMQGLPSAANLHERFLETRMAASLLLRDRVRTRIVQAVGRCTRSATDYSAVCIVGNELQDRLLQRENIQLYHPEMQAELLFGYDESKAATGIDDFLDMYRIFLAQNEDWKDADAQILMRRQDYERKPDPLMDKLQKAVSYELYYQRDMWAGDYQGALKHANSVASLLDGDELKGYRGFWYYLAGSAAWLAAQNDESFAATARNKFNQAAHCTNSVTWLRNLVPAPSKNNDKTEDDKHLAFLIERLEGQLSKLGISSDRKFNCLVQEILSGLASNTDGNAFEQAHVKLGTLLGYDAGNTEDTGGPDPWWICGNDFCLVSEDYTETDGSKPIPLYKVRQLTTHPTYIQNHVTGLAANTEYVRVFISPSQTIEDSAVTYAQELTFWHQPAFLDWANQAVQVVRSLRLDFTETGNELWRSKAMEAYRDARLDPKGIKSLLSRLSDLTSTIGKTESCDDKEGK